MVCHHFRDIISGFYLRKSRARLPEHLLLGTFQHTSHAHTHAPSSSMLLITYALVAFTLSPLSMRTTAHTMRDVIVRMDEAPADTALAPPAVKESTPASKAAAKAAYDANKAKRVAKKAPKVGAAGTTGATKKRKNSQFDKAKRRGTS